MSRDKLTLRKEPGLEELKKMYSELEAQFERVDRERIEYLQNVSHQLVAPLNAIKWHIENLTEGRLSVERGKKVLRSIYSQSTIAVHLAKNFALMSNLEEDHALSSLKEPLQEIPLCALLINLADDFQPLGWDKDLQIGVSNRSFERAPPVLAMKPLISQVFSNIIENAVKYSSSGSEIVIDGYHDDVKDVVFVKVRNKGIPLPNPASAVFGRGYRSSEAKHKYPAGTGFGLYIAKRIVEIHSGTISASTDEFGWSEFLVGLSVRDLAGKARIRDAKDSSPSRR